MNGLDCNAWRIKPWYRRVNWYGLSVAAVLMAASVIVPFRLAELWFPVPSMEVDWLIVAIIASAAAGFAIVLYLVLAWRDDD